MPQLHATEPLYSDFERFPIKDENEDTSELVQAL